MCEREKGEEQRAWFERNEGRQGKERRTGRVMLLKEMKMREIVSEN